MSNSLEDKFHKMLMTPSISEELARADRLFNLLQSRSFYGEVDVSSQRTMGALYDNSQLGYYEIPVDALISLAHLSKLDDVGAALSAAITETLKIQVPPLIKSEFSRKYWEYLAQARGRDWNREPSIMDILEEVLSIKRSQVLKLTDEKMKIILSVFRAIYQHSPVERESTNEKS